MPQGIFRVVLTVNPSGAGLGFGARSSCRCFARGKTLALTNLVRGTSEIRIAFIETLFQ